MPLSTSEWRLTSQRVLEPGGVISPATVHIGDGVIQRVDALGSTEAGARNLLILPGIVDLHGDAFERQLMPRGGVRFPYDVALWDTDRQVAANGITTAFYGLTVSWEPGLRGLDAGTEFIRSFMKLRPRLRADSRLHLRFETFSLEACPTVQDWLTSGLVDLLAFNDHTEFIANRIHSKPQSIHKYTDRTLLHADTYMSLLSTVRGRTLEAQEAVNRLAAIARQANIPMASHDDESPEKRDDYRNLGCAICEFPIDEATARAAFESGDEVVLGAPNVVRGGSHAGRLRACDAIRSGLCTVLASDYYYPSMLHAAFLLAREGVLSLGDAWDLVSRNPARAAGLRDRGEIAAGKRADLLVVDDSDPEFPVLVQTIVGGRVSYSLDRPSLNAVADECLPC